MVQRRNWFAARCREEIEVEVVVEEDEESVSSRQTSPLRRTPRGHDRDGDGRRGGGGGSSSTAIVGEWTADVSGSESHDGQYKLTI
jgi:hypothetical protein